MNNPQSPDHASTNGSSTIKENGHGTRSPWECLFETYHHCQHDDDDDDFHDENENIITQKKEELKENGFIILSNILNDEHCQKEISNVWKFYFDVNNIQPKKSSSSSSSTSSSYSWKSNRESMIGSPPQQEHYYQHYGAGYLFGETRELLCQTIFEPLYRTRKLHTSKEGFRLFVVPEDEAEEESSNIVTNTEEGNITTTKKTEKKTTTETTTNSCIKSTFQVPNYHPSSTGGNKNDTTTSNNQIESEPLCLRALVVVSSGSDSMSVKCTIPSSVSTNHDGNKTAKQVSLNTGDVLLFRSDIQIKEEYVIQTNTNAFDIDETNTNDKKVMEEEENNDDGENDNDIQPPIIFYCSMQPAIDLFTNKRLWNQKIEAYKQRQTSTTYLTTEEKWSSSSSTSTSTVGRNYFRTHPPLVSKRLAELYGLIPYFQNDDDEDNETLKKELERAVIRGVRFADDTYDEISSGIRLPCDVQSIQLTSSDPHLLTGQDKYLGGMSSPCGKYVYGVPGTAKRVIRISTETGKMDCIGPNYMGKFKWLRGVEIPASAMLSSSSSSSVNDDSSIGAHVDDKYPDGCCIALPCNHLSFLKVNPATNEVYTFGTSTLQDLCGNVDGWYYHGGNLASSGWIYCIPANAPRVVKLNPYSDEVIGIGPSFPGRCKWFGGIIGSDGMIYGIPHNERGVLQINPLDDTVRVLHGIDGPLPEGNWKWHGGLAAGHKIIGFPNNSDQVLMIDCQKSMIYTIGNSSILQSGRHRIPQDGRYKYLGGALSKDKQYVYFFPCDAERVMKLNCVTNQLSLVGPCLLDGENKFQNGFCGQDGCLYGIPQRAVGILRIIPSSIMSSSMSSSSSVVDDIDDDDYVDIIPCGENMMHVKDKFEGGVLGKDGSIYCIPLRARSCVKIVPPPASPVAASDSPVAAER